MDFERISVEEFYNSDAFRDLQPLLKGSSRRNSLILGIGAFSHDTSASLINSKTNEVLFAQSEERNSNLKHDSGFPIQAVLNAIKNREEDISRVSVNFSPDLFLNDGFMRNLEIQGFSGNKQVLKSSIDNVILEQVKNGFELNNRLANSISEKLKGMIDIRAHQKWIDREGEYYLLQYRKYLLVFEIIKKLFPEIPVIPVKHHTSHAASTFYSFAGDEETAILVLDGHGEANTCSIYDSNFRELSHTFWPMSLGSLYLTATRYLGYDYGDEYKVMGMAAYGKPQYAELLMSFIKIDKVVKSLVFGENEYYRPTTIGKSGQVRYEFTETFAEILPRRHKSTPFSQIHFDFAASIQKVTENIGLDFSVLAKELTDCSTLMIAGGVGLNGLMNERIRKTGLFKNVEVYPAAGDDGTSVGSAQYISGVQTKKKITSIFVGGDHCGSKSPNLDSLLEKYPVRYSLRENFEKDIAKLIVDGNIIARYSESSEFGPRALGNRSILANPLIQNMKDILNLRIKHREEFRPFAPAVLREDVNDYFEFAEDSPFMLFIPKAKQFLKELCPCIVHNDLTARIQTVDRKGNPSFHRIISEFKKITGIPILVNTSFNLNGETIVETPQDAIESFLFMDIDYLFIENVLVRKIDGGRTFASGFKNHRQFLQLRKDRYMFDSPNALKSLDCRLYGDWFYMND